MKFHPYSPPIAVSFDILKETTMSATSSTSIPLSSTTTTTTEEIDYYDQLSEVNKAEVSPTNYPSDLFNMETCGQAKGNVRIAGGSKAEVLEFPWVALIGYGLQPTLNFGCGGSLISEKFVLTASHCLINRFNTPMNAKLVRLGEHTKSTDTDCNDRLCADPVQDISINRHDFIIHQNYSHSHLKNDIALIRLGEFAKTSQNNIKTICLPFTLENVPSRLIASGFGKTEVSYANSDVLMKVHVGLKDKRECSVDLRINGTDRELEDTQICAGGRRDSCGGDSGSSLHAFDGTLLRNIQFGIVSFGATECGSDHPGVYTNIYKYLPWIEESIRKII